VAPSAADCSPSVETPYPKRSTWNQGCKPAATPTWISRDARLPYLEVPAPHIHPGSAVNDARSPLQSPG
jgi:hypothetical protein